MKAERVHQSLLVTMGPLCGVLENRKLPLGFKYALVAVPFTGGVWVGAIDCVIHSNLSSVHWAEGHISFLGSAHKE